MKLQLLTSIDDIRNGKLQWNTVAGQCPFFRHEWLIRWLETWVDDVEPAVLVAQDEQNEWLGIAPFCIESGKMFRKLRLLGSGTVCSDYHGLISKSDHAKTFAEQVTDWLSTQLQTGGQLGQIDVVELEGINASDPALKYWLDLMSATGFKTHSVPLEGCWVVELSDSWDEMNARFSKSLRRKTKKAVQRLASDDSRVRTSDDEPLENLWPIFVDLHQQRREMLGQAGCFADSRFESFLMQATNELVSVDLAELLVVEHQNQPLCAYLLLNDGEQTMMYQSGMDSDRLSLEPGYQLAVLGLQRSIKKGFRSFDFLRGDEPYKSRWQTERVELSRTRLIPRKFTSQFKHGIWEAGCSMKQYLRSRSERV